MHFLIPVTYFISLPLTSPLVTISWFSIGKSLSLGLSLVFSPFAHLFCFLNSTWVKLYGYLSFSDLFYLALYSLDPSTSLQMARFHSLFYNFFKVYLFWERHRASRGGGRENHKQGLHCQHRAQCGARTHQIMRSWFELKLRVVYIATQVPHISFFLKAE